MALSTRLTLVLCPTRPALLLARYQASGYHCVFQESSLRLLVKPPPPRSSSPSSPLLDVEVTNRHLMGILTRDSLGLLIQLAAQVSEGGGLPQHGALTRPKGRGEVGHAGYGGPSGVKILSYIPLVDVPQPERFHILLTAI